jgi:hypothetical protein
VDGPFDVDDQLSTLCSVDKQALGLTGAVMGILQFHFSNPDSVQHPQLKGYIWNNDVKLSKILLQHVWQWKIQTGEKRPAILVKRNALNYESVAIGDGAATVTDLDDDTLPLTGQTEMQLSCAGSHTIFALSMIPGEAEILAGEIATKLVQFGQAIRQELGFSKFNLTTIGEIFSVEEASGYFGVPITLAYRYAEAWLVESEGPFLKRFAFGTKI